MGTNFYWRRNLYLPVELLPKKLRYFADKIIEAGNDSQVKEDDILIHIGKRSGAGRYCFKCNTTLCIHGDRGIHYHANVDNWYLQCPICGADHKSENTPVASVCSFTWTVMNHRLLLKALTKPSIALALSLAGKDEVVVDEYNEKLTAGRFLEEIDSPINFQSPCEFS